MDSGVRRLAGVVLAAFVATFLAARILVLLIMTHRVPDLYLYIGGTHVHHLNFGIFLLVGVGAYLLFSPPAKRSLAAVLYGVGLAMTFDEFGMWFHLGGSYWGRASFDAVVLIAGLLALVVVAPVLKNFRPRHWVTAVALAAAVGIFAVLLVETLAYTSRVILPRLEQLESAPRPRRAPPEAGSPRPAASDSARGRAGTGPPDAPTPGRVCR